MAHPEGAALEHGDRPSPHRRVGRRYPQHVERQGPGYVTRWGAFVDP